MKKKNKKKSKFYFILKQKPNVPCDPRINLQVRFSFFILILKTKNHIYLNIYLIKLITISPHTVIINKCKRIIYLYWSNIKFLEIKLFLFKLNEIGICKIFSIWSNLLKKMLQQCRWYNSSVVIITFRHITFQLGAFTV